MFLGLPMTATLELNSNLRSVPGVGFFTGDVFSVEIRKTHRINFFFFPFSFWLILSIWEVWIVLLILVFVWFCRNWFVPAQDASGTKTYKQGALQTPFVKV